MFIRGQAIAIFVLLTLALPVSSALAVSRGPAVDYLSTARAVAADPTLLTTDRLERLEKLRAQLEASKGLRGKPEAMLQADSDWKALNEVVQGLRLAQDNSQIQQINETLRSITAKANDLMVQRMGETSGEIEKLRVDYTTAFELKEKLLKNLSDDTNLIYGQTSRGLDRAPAQVSADQALTR